MKSFFTRRILILAFALYFCILFLSCQSSQDTSINTQKDSSKPQNSKLTVEEASRYIQPLFDNLDIEKNILYKEVKNSKGELEKLYLDVYQPAGDKAENRAAIVWVHGGGFTSGDKSVGMEKNLAVEFAKMGYVTLSINYRLRQNPSADWVGTFTDSTDDAAAAVDWLVQNSPKYRVDKNHIALAGYSAGACIVTNLTYKGGENAKWNKKSIFAVVELAGNRIWMGTPHKNDPPCAIIHGTKDETVPFAEGEMLAQTLKGQGVDYIFHPVKDANHNLQPSFYEVQDVAAKFLYKALTGKDI
ncbi:MAG: alpha/beta hydrolase [Clostridia bacterium]|nr:alpha/beta hydrolase [Clostridia bacterium]